jgi:hypothetical protein
MDTRKKMMPAAGRELNPDRGADFLWDLGVAENVYGRLK